MAHGLETAIRELPQELQNIILKDTMSHMSERERARLRVASRSHRLPLTTRQDMVNQLDRLKRDKRDNDVVRNAYRSHGMSPHSRQHIIDELLRLWRDPRTNKTAFFASFFDAFHGYVGIFSFRHGNQNLAAPLLDLIHDPLRKPTSAETTYLLSLMATMSDEDLAIRVRRVMKRDYRGLPWAYDSDSKYMFGNLKRLHF